MTETVRTRFAPSPTGDLHVGGARTALFNWLFTRHEGGEFILRIEDTDFDRSAQKYVDRILSAMRWLGLDWDEGPEVGGPHGPYAQSERLDVYEDIVDRLKKKDKIYKCYCTKEELEKQRQRQRDRGEPPRYSGRCRDLSDEEEQKFIDEGRDFTYRYRIPRKPVTVRDIAKGDVSFPPDQVGDFIIIKSNGSPSYNFAVVVDDQLMNITHVIRGDDHLSNTPRQLYLYDAFDWEPPTWVHLAMILGQDGERLSKRHGATDVQEYRDDGFLPEAMNNALALLGWSPPDGEEVKPIPDLIEEFSLDRVSKSASRFDFDKVRWLNGQHLRSLSAEELVARFKPFLPEQMNERDRDQLPELLDTLREQLELLTDFAPLYETFFQQPVEPSEEALDWLRERPEAVTVVDEFASRLEAVSTLDGDATGDVIGDVDDAVEASGRDLYLPMRIAVTGRMEGPEFHEMMPLLGKERCLNRVRTVLEAVQ